VKDVFRNTKRYFADQAMEIACGLHKFRTTLRDHALEGNSNLIISDNVYCGDFSPRPQRARIPSDPARTFSASA
jgi:hypothetical protein